MEDNQRELYAQILEEVRPKVFSAVAQKGVRGASFSILAALLRLRQVCNHPNSIDALRAAPGYESGKFNLLRELVEEALASGRNHDKVPSLRTSACLRINLWANMIGEGISSGVSSQA